MAGLRQTLAAAINRSSTNPNYATISTDPTMGNVYMSHTQPAQPSAPSMPGAQTFFGMFRGPSGAPGPAPMQNVPNGVQAGAQGGLIDADHEAALAAKDREIERLKRELRKADEKSNFFRNQVMALQQQISSMDKPVTSVSASAAMSMSAGQRDEVQRLRTELAEERAARQALQNSGSNSARGSTRDGGGGVALQVQAPSSPTRGISGALEGMNVALQAPSSPTRGISGALGPSTGPPQALNFRGDPLDPNENPGGQRRALIIGCDYPGKIGTLRAGVADAQQWARFFVKRCSFAEQDVRLLSDDPAHLHQRERPDTAIATRDTILRALQWLVSRSARGDQLFFIFCGHGAQIVVEDWAGQKLCESAIAPTDVCADGDQPRVVSDTDVHKALQLVPSGVQVTLVYDCCHAGRPLDRQGLDHLAPYVSRGRVDYEKLRGHPVLPRFLELQQWKVRPTPAEAVRESTLRCQAVQWAACANEQFCVELPIDERPRGVFTYMFICALLKVGVHSSSEALLREIQALTAQLKGRWRLQQEALMTVARATSDLQPFLRN